MDIDSSVACTLDTYYTMDITYTFNNKKDDIKVGKSSSANNARSMHVQLIL